VRWSSARVDEARVRRPTRSALPIVSCRRVGGWLARQRGSEGGRLRGRSGGPLGPAVGPANRTGEQNYGGTGAFAVGEDASRVCGPMGGT
jgi:hypothetical protein